MVNWQSSNITINQRKRPPCEKIIQRNWAMSLRLTNRRSKIIYGESGGESGESGDIHDKYCQGENRDFPLPPSAFKFCIIPYRTIYSIR